jgi:type VI secretion system protein ImpI
VYSSPPAIERTSEHRNSYSPAEAPVASGASAGGSIELDELLRAAGVTSAQMSPDTARELGEVLRIVIEGVMEVLQARAEIKAQFRMTSTRVQASENNPLKFSPNVEAALHTLLVERNRAYLAAPRAFTEAFADIRDHQMAVIEGIRTGFNAMLAKFDPDRLKEDFEKQSRGGLLSGGKARLWDQYTEHFRTLTADPNDAFRNLFGDEFAEAYEQQLERLKTTGRRARS